MINLANDRKKRHNELIKQLHMKIQAIERERARNDRRGLESIDFYEMNLMMMEDFKYATFENDVSSFGQDEPDSAANMSSSKGSLGMLKSDQDIPSQKSIHGGTSMQNSSILLDKEMKPVNEEMRINEIVAKQNAVRTQELEGRRQDLRVRQQ